MAKEIKIEIPISKLVEAMYQVDDGNVLANYSVSIETESEPNFIYSGPERKQILAGVCNTRAYLVFTLKPLENS